MRLVRGGSNNVWVAQSLGSRLDAAQTNSRDEEAAVLELVYADNLHEGSDPARGKGGLADVGLDVRKPHRARAFKTKRRLTLRSLRRPKRRKHCQCKVG